MKKILIALLLFSCNQEDVANKACAKLEQLEYYANKNDSTIKPMEIRAILKGKDDFDIIGCSKYEANVYILNYECEKYPESFWDTYALLWWDGSKCND